LKPQFEQTSNSLLVRAPAKINLSLLIAGKRSDGFHEIETIMSKVNLYDELLFEKAGKPGIELICNGKYAAPSDKTNLVYRACKMACESAGGQGTEMLRQGIRVTLTKNIPVGAGLGGGSSDAASALLAINKFVDLGLSEQKNYEIACSLGSDVPFFLYGSMGLCTGRGEVIIPISEKYIYRAILVLPDVNVSTKEVYVNYKHNNSEYNRLRGKIIHYIGEKKIDFIPEMCANMLEPTCFAMNAELGEIKSRIMSLGIGRVCLSGSGSAMFILKTNADLDDIERYQAVLKESIGCDTIVVDNNRW
jgi:4-diphosphocytidyl-2-C-methyl-D-erythritol kinase